MEHCLCVRPLGPKRHRNEILSESRGRGRLFDLVQDLAERTRVRHIRGLWSVGTHSLSLMHATTNTCHPDWGAQISDRINWDSNTIPVFCEHRNINKRTTPGTRRQGCQKGGRSRAQDGSRLAVIDDSLSCESGRLCFHPVSQRCLDAASCDSRKRTGRLGSLPVGVQHGRIVSMTDA